MNNGKITFEQAMQIGLEGIAPEHHEFAKLMMTLGAKLVLSAVDNADNIDSLKRELSSDPTTPYSSGH